MPRNLVFVCALACAAPRSAQFSAAAGCGGHEYGRLDFWVGTWDVADPSGARQGENVISRTLDGCAVEERWTDAAGATGMSLFFHDRALGRWKQVWVTSAGGWKEKTEEPGTAPGSVRFAGELPRPGGGTVLDRTTLTPLADGRVRQVIEQSADGGRSWKAWEGLYTRRPPAQACDNREFDFWLGEWDLVVRARTAPDRDEWAEAKGHNRIESTYGGCVIEEHFRADGPGTRWAGHSVSMFQHGRWRQTWVDDSGAYLAFVGGWSGTEMRLDGEAEGAIFKRMVFGDIRKDSLRWRWERTGDGGKSWVPLLIIDYRRH